MHKLKMQPLKQFEPGVYIELNDTFSGTGGVGEHRAAVPAAALDVDHGAAVKRCADAALQGELPVGHIGQLASHLGALREHGACPQHRRSFAPVREVLGG